MTTFMVETENTAPDPAVSEELTVESEEFADTPSVEHTDLAMVALIPTAGNVERLALGDGQDPEEIHCTVLFLGDAANISDEAFAAMRDAVEEVAQEEESPLVADAFNVSMFNPHRGDMDTCVVLGLTGAHLATLATLLRTRVEDALVTQGVETPEQHAPWIPHVTLAYTDDFQVMADYADRTGEITFDRVRLARGSEFVDIPLGAPEEPVNTETEFTENEVTQAVGSQDNATETFEVAYTAPEDQDVGAEIAEETVETTGGEPGSWNGVLVVEDVESGDGRMFSGGSLKTAPLPLPLMWQKQTDEGHKTAVQVGRIDDVWRDGNQIWGSGVFDLDGAEGQEAYRQVEAKFLRGVSVDVDSVKNSDIEMIFPKMTGEEDDFEKLFAAPDVTVFHHGRLRGATLVQFPAFVEASISLTGGDVVAAPEALEASLEELPIADRTSGAIVAAGPGEDVPEDDDLPDAALTIQEAGCAHNAMTACGCGEQPTELTQAPDRSLFENPNFTGPTAFTVDGMHVYGHAALRGTCHTGFAGQCVTMPVEGDHAYFLLGETLCSDGTTVATGTITLGTGHAGTDGRVTAMDAIKHYDHTGTVVADIVTGEDEFGLWFSGALRSDLPPSKIRSLRAAKLSGDWRKFGNKLRLVALLAVNVPGFPVPRLRTAVHNGRQVALVAAGINPVDVRAQEKQKTQESFRTVLASLACRIGRDPGTRMSELKSHVHGR